MLTSSNSQSSFYYDQSPISTEDQNQETPFILNFSSSFDENESPLCEIFSRYKPMAMDHQESKNNIVPTSNKKSNELEINGVIKPPRRRRTTDVIPRKKKGKKDRHSKICTAQGVRDRRMRLSLPIARKFFDLQDILGFDKASKTIEWLFSKSRKAITKLLITNNLSPSNHRYLSDVEYVNLDDDEEEEEEDDEGDDDNIEKMIEKEELSKSRKVMTNYQNAKESRDKARERARERTLEKMKVRRNKLWYDSSNLTTNIDLDQPFSCYNFHDFQKGAFHEGHAHTIEHCYENLGKLDEKDCNNNNGFMGIPGNWDANGNRMNPSSIGGTSNNMVSFPGNNPTSVWFLPSSKTFPFSLQ